MNSGALLDLESKLKDPLVESISLENWDVCSGISQVSTRPAPNFQACGATDKRRDTQESQLPRIENDTMMEAPGSNE